MLLQSRRLIRATSVYHNEVYDSRLTLFSITSRPTSSFFFFFLNDPAPPEIYPLPLHDALPISRIARRRQRIDCRTAGERQTENAGPLVERLARRVIDRPADHRDAAVLLPSDQVTVAPGHDQSEDRRAEVRLLEQPGEDMGGEVTDADHRQLARPGDRLPEVDAHQKAADQARPPGHSDTIDLLPAGARVLQRALDHRHQRLKVGARGNFRNDPAVGGVQRILRANHVREQARATSD